MPLHPKIRSVATVYYERIFRRISTGVVAAVHKIFGIEKNIKVLSLCSYRALAFSYGITSFLLIFLAGCVFGTIMEN